MIKLRVINSNKKLYKSQKQVSKIITNRIRAQFIDENNEDHNIVFSVEDDYDYLLVINDCFGHEIRVPSQKVMGLILEPPFYLEDYNPEIGKYCKQVYTCAHKKYYQNNANFISSPSMMFYHLNGRSELYKSFKSFRKPKRISLCISNLSGNQMYEFRHELIHKILESDLEIDIYGKGWDFFDSRYKGSPDDKAAALIPYEFSIAIENSLYDAYVSEKLFDCFLCNTVPVYYGSRSADFVYSPKSFIRMPHTENIPELISWLKELSLGSVNNFDYQDAVLASKKKFFEKYNLYNQIRKFIYDN